MPNVDVNGTTIEFPDTLSGDELNQAVSKAASQIGQSKQPQNDPMSLGGFGENVLKDIPYQAKQIGSGLVNLGKASYEAPFQAGKTLFNTGKQLYEGQSLGQTDLGQAADQAGNIVVGMLPHPNPEKPLLPLKNWEPGGLLQNVAHPYEHPIGAALDVATAVLPFAGEAKGTSMLSKTAEAPSLFRKGASKVLSLLGPEEESLMARMNDPKAIQEAGTIADVSNTFPGIGNKFNKIIGHLSDKADQVISKSTTDALAKEDVMNAVQKARKNLGGIYTDEGRTAAKTLERVGNSFNRTRNAVTQNQVRGIIQNLDNEIPWTKVWKSPESLTASDHAMMDVRGELDSILKAKNPEYANLMKPVSDAIQSRNEFLKRFNIEKIKGKGYQLGDNTVNRAANTLNENKVASQRVLEGVKETTGEDVMSKLQNAKFKEQFQPPTSHTLDDILRTKPETLISLIQNRFGRQAAGALADAINTGSKNIPEKMFKNVGAIGNVSGKVLNEETIAKFMAENDYDPKKAAQAAEAQGYIW